MVGAGHLLFIIDFDIGHPDRVGEVWVGARRGLYTSEKLRRREGDDTLVGTICGRERGSRDSECHVRVVRVRVA